MKKDDKKIQSFWVEINGKPQLVKGELIPEEDDDWCPGELRLHVTTPNSPKRVYPHYFNTQEELIKHEIEMIEFQIQFEKEQFDAETESLEKDRDHWKKMLVSISGDKNNAY